ncbi:helix-turn-helix transcriptional regulator [Yoonia vestfoldensis]|uniref:helix-turn-helix transcriptional regulator n=1 Tax=Yoonia vestfoldensis TaxID=245188 RepID=UPI0012FFA288|nr:helix-turn-helix transcriptional regulator [Yoonia vestfoldensis]
MISGKQCRAARAGLGLSQGELAILCRVVIRTIVHFEAGAREPRVLTLEAIAKVFADRGVTFTDHGVFIPIAQE